MSSTKSCHSGSNHLHTAAIASTVLSSGFLCGYLAGVAFSLHQFIIFTSSKNSSGSGPASGNSDNLIVTGNNQRDSGSKRNSLGLGSSPSNNRDRDTIPNTVTANAPNYMSPTTSRSIKTAFTSVTYGTSRDASRTPEKNQDNSHKTPSVSEIQSIVFLNIHEYKNTLKRLLSMVLLSHLGVFGLGFMGLDGCPRKNTRPSDTTPGTNLTGTGTTTSQQIIPSKCPISKITKLFSNITNGNSGNSLCCPGFMKCGALISSFGIFVYLYENVVRGDQVLNQSSKDTDGVSGINVNEYLYEKTWKKVVWSYFGFVLCTIALGVV